MWNFGELEVHERCGIVEFVGWCIRDLVIEVRRDWRDIWRHSCCSAMSASQMPSFLVHFVVLILTQDTKIWSWTCATMLLLFPIRFFASLRTWICSLPGPHTAHMYDSHPSNGAISASPLVVMATFTRRYFANIRQALQLTSCSFHSFDRLIRLVFPLTLSLLHRLRPIHTNPWCFTTSVETVVTISCAPATLAKRVFYCF